jgi:hypothetical protein
MGSYDPFGYLKHKLWPKKRLRIKLSIWLLTTKCQESPWFCCIQVMCNILLKSFRQGILHCFTSHLNQRSTHKVMGFQNHESSIFENFGTPTWESRDKMTFGASPVAKHQEYYKGEGGGFPQVWVVVSLVSPCLPMAHLCTKSVLTMH